MAVGILSTLLSPGTSPQARNVQAQCYWPSTGLVYVSLGATNTSAATDTWSFNGTAWTQIPTAHNPGALADFAMAYDPISGNIIGFGGYNGTSSNNNTWSFNGSDWSQLAPADSPAARSEHIIFNDPITNQVCIAFGNDASSTYYDDMWTWTGTNWTEVTSAATGTSRSAPGGATMASNATTVVFGGYTSSTVLSDTWVWNGTDWTNADPGTTPNATCYESLCYLPSIQNVVMFGGENSARDNVLSTMYLWNGTNWTLITPTGSTIPGIAQCQTTWLPSINAAVVFGGGNFSTDYSTTYTLAGTTGAGISHPTGFPLGANDDEYTSPAPSSYTMPHAYDHLGDLAIFGAIYLSSTVNITAVSGTQSGTWTRQNTRTDTTNVIRQDIWTAPVTGTASADILTLTWSAATTGIYASYWGDSLTAGLGSTTTWTVPKIGGVGPTASEATANYPSLLSVTTSNFQAYWGIGVGYGTLSGGTTSGFTYIDSESNSGTEEVYNLSLASDTTYSPNTTQSPSGAFDLISVIFMASAAAIASGSFFFAGGGAGGGASVAPVPTVTGLNPTSGVTTGSTSVAIAGSNFTGATAVKFGGTNASSYHVNSAASITAVSPSGSAGAVDVTVTTSAGTSATSSADKFTYTTAGVPLLGFYTQNNDVSGIQSLASTLGVTVQGYETYCSGNSWSSIAAGIGPSGADFTGTIPSGSYLFLGVNMCPGGTGISSVASNLSSFTTLANGLSSLTSNGVTVICRIGWEFDGRYRAQTFPWGPPNSTTNPGAPSTNAGNSPSTYATAFQQIVTTMRAANSALKFDFCCNTGDSDLAVLETYYPGDSYTDYIGGDHYDDPDGTSGGDQTVFSACVNLAVARGKPLSIGEWGLDGGDDPTFINAMAQIINDPATAAARYGWPTYTVGYQCYFSDPDYNSEITSYPNSQAAYSSAFAGE